MLQQLGINATVYIQFIIYIITFPVLLIFIFKPFAKANEERQNRTKGTEQLSYEFQQKTQELQTRYQERAREISTKIQDIYGKIKTEAAREQEALVSQAKNEAQKTTDENHKKISALVDVAAEQLRGQTTQLSLTITQKLLGKS